MVGQGERAGAEYNKAQPALELYMPQSEGVADYRYGGQAHRGRSDDWRQQEADDRVEDAGCYRHTYTIVNKGEK